jgi:hypothetical protein
MTAQFKRGDTLTLSVTDDDVNLANVTIESAVKHGSKFYQALTVSDIDADAGTFIMAASSTSNWPLGSIDCDIKYTTVAGEISRSFTFQIMIIEEVTK